MSGTQRGADRPLSRRSLLAGGAVLGAAGFAAGTRTGSAATPVAATSTSLRIGALLPLNGSLAPTGTLMRNGMTLAVAGVNAAGGAGGRHVELVVFDTDVTNDDSVAQGCARLVAEAVHAAVSGFLIAWRRGYAVYGTYRAPFLHFSSSQEQQTYVAGQQDCQFFQTTPSESVYGSGLVDVLNRLRSSGSWTPSSNRIQFLTRQLPHTEAIESAARSAAKAARRWVVAPTVVLGPPVASWAGQVRTLQAQAPAVVVVNTTDLTEAGEFFLAARKAKLPALLYYPGPTAKVPGFEVDGLLTARVAGTYTGDAVSAEFTKAYTAVYRQSPDTTYASAAYDAVQMLLAAWGQADPESFAAVNTVLRRQVWRGVQGSAWLGSDGQTALSYPSQTADASLGKALLFTQRTKGADLVVDPAPFVQAPFTAPQ